MGRKSKKAEIRVEKDSSTEGPGRQTGGGPAAGSAAEPRRAEAGRPRPQWGPPRRERDRVGRPSPRGAGRRCRRRLATGTGAALNDHALGFRSARGPKPAHGASALHSKPDGGRGGVLLDIQGVSTGKQTIKGKVSTWGPWQGRGPGGGEARHDPQNCPRHRPGQRCTCGKRTFLKYARVGGL